MLAPAAFPPGRRRPVSAGLALDVPRYLLRPALWPGVEQTWTGKWGTARVPTSRAGEPAPHRVFISSASGALGSYRETAVDVCRRLEMMPVFMEEFGPQGPPPEEVCPAAGRELRFVRAAAREPVRGAATGEPAVVHGAGVPVGGDPAEGSAAARSWWTRSSRGRRRTWITALTPRHSRRSVPGEVPAHGETLGRRGRFRQDLLIALSRVDLDLGRRRESDEADPRRRPVRWAP